MKQTRLWAAAGIIAVVIFASFALSVPRAREIARTSFLSEQPEPYEVTVTDSYKKGMHTFAGVITVPDACTSVAAEAAVIGEASAPEGIRIALALPDESGICLQVPTKIDFRTALEAPADLPVTVTVNGVAASTTVL